MIKKETNLLKTLKKQLKIRWSNFKY
jgi:hypothetical protein